MTAPPPHSPAHSVNVLLGVVRGVILDDPVHCGDVQPPGSHICAEQDTFLGLVEVQERRGPPLLLLLAVYVLQAGNELRPCLPFLPGRQKPGRQRLAPSSPLVM